MMEEHLTMLCDHAKAKFAQNESETGQIWMSIEMGWTGQNRSLQHGGITVEQDKNGSEKVNPSHA